MDDEGEKIDRVRLNVIEHGDIKQNPDALGHLSLDTIEEGLGIGAPGLKGDVTVTAEELYLSDPSANGDRFLEIVLREIDERRQRHQTVRTKYALSDVAGVAVRARVITPRIRLARIKNGALPGLAESMLSVAEDEFKYPIGINLRAALPLSRPSNHEEESSAN